MTDTPGLTIEQLQKMLPDETYHWLASKQALAGQLIATMQREAFNKEFFTRIIKAAPYHSLEWNTILQIATEANAAVGSCEYRDTEAKKEIKDPFMGSDC